MITAISPALGVKWGDPVFGLTHIKEIAGDTAMIKTLYSDAEPANGLNKWGCLAP